MRDGSAAPVAEHSLPIAYPSDCWARETALPDTVINSGPALATAADEATFEFHDPTEQAIAFKCRQDDASDWVACVSGRYTWGGELSEGLHRLSVRAVSLDGRADPSPAQWVWEVRSNQIDTVIVSGPLELSTLPSAGFAYRDHSGSAERFECAHDEGEWTACDDRPVGTGDLVHTWPEPLADGPHRISIRGVSADGAVELEPATWEWVVDRSAPVVSFASVPMGVSDGGDLHFSVSDPTEDAVGFTCRPDGDAWRDCGGSGDAAWQRTFIWAGPLTDGLHTLEVSAYDAVGNLSDIAVWQGTVDSIDPETELLSGPTEVTVPGSNARFVFDDPTRDAVGFECRAPDSTEWDGCGEWDDDAAAHVYQWDGELRDNQSYRFEVRAIDAAGNVDETPAEWSWTVRLDLDGDGVGTRDDNCVSVANAEQIDSDDDGLGDACDPVFAALPFEAPAPEALLWELDPVDSEVDIAVSVDGLGEEHDTPVASADALALPGCSASGKGRAASASWTLALLGALFWAWRRRDY